MTTTLKTITVKGVLNGIDTLITFESDLNIDGKTDFVATINYITDLLAIRGFESKSIKPTQWTKDRQASGATGQDADSLIQWVDQKTGKTKVCEVCKQPMSLVHFTAKRGPYIGQKSLMGVHTVKSKCENRYFFKPGQEPVNL